MMVFDPHPVTVFDRGGALLGYYQSSTAKLIEPISGENYQA
jgi:hypothetical protein